MMITIPDRDLEITAIRASGPGGQNVNKVSSAIQLRFDIPRSSLPNIYKVRLLHFLDRRITKEGIMVIKAQQQRTQTANKREALKQLYAFIERAVVVKKKRKPTKRTRISESKRLDSKHKHSKQKELRANVTE